jgi:hypothetical protein
MKCPFHSHEKQSNNNLKGKEVNGEKNEENGENGLNEKENDKRKSRSDSKSFVLRTHSQENRLPIPNKKALKEVKNGKRSLSQKHKFIRIYQNFQHGPSIAKRKKLDIFKTGSPIRNTFVIFNEFN